jgi:(p)ppGpp synthase/HD superfamily hydrolase
MRHLETAIIIATNAHMGQFDKAGAPYILHPLRVMMRMTTIKGKIVGVCHDLIEDTHITLKDLVSEGFSDDVICAIDCMTKCPGESYNAYLNRVISDVLASECKLEDMRDNSNIYRLNKVRKKHLQMIAKYHKGALRILEAHPQFEHRFKLIN